MSNQAAVHSIDALKELRAALAVFAEESLEALGAVEMEVRRTLQWLQHDRRLYWQDQIKRRREKMAAAQAELFRRQLAKRPDSSPSCVEQKELLRKAEASFQEAEMRLLMVKKWEPALQQALFEYHGSVRRIKSLSSGDVPRALARLERMIVALEAYLRVPVPSTPASGQGERSPLEQVVGTIFEESPEEEGQGVADEVARPADSSEESSGPT